MNAQIQNNNPLINIEQKLNLLQSENSSLKIKIQSFHEIENLYQRKSWENKINSIRAIKDLFWFNWRFEKKEKNRDENF